jgi:hypothetical protein
MIEASWRFARRSQWPWRVWGKTNPTISARPMPKRTQRLLQLISDPRRTQLRPSGHPPLDGRRRQHEANPGWPMPGKNEPNGANSGETSPCGTCRGMARRDVDERESLERESLGWGSANILFWTGDGIVPSIGVISSLVRRRNFVSAREMVRTSEFSGIHSRQPEDPKLTVQPGNYLSKRRYLPRFAHHLPSARKFLEGIGRRERSRQRQMGQTDRFCDEKW